MKRFYALLPLLALMLVCGCRSRIEVDGESYSMLTDRERAELVFFARQTMIRNSPLSTKKHRDPDSPDLITIDEANEVRAVEPDLKIEYRGDCAGEAVVTWDLPNRKIEVVIEGQLNDPYKRDLMLRVMKKYGPVLDFRDKQDKKAGAVSPQP